MISNLKGNIIKYDDTYFVKIETYLQNNLMVGDDKKRPNINELTLFLIN